jgi:hypothetical protein
MGNNSSAASRSKRYAESMTKLIRENSPSLSEGDLSELKSQIEDIALDELERCDKEVKELELD